MSSARLPIALAILALAACAHTPSENTYLMPDVKDRAPVLVASSSEVPDGYDDHIVVSVDMDALRDQQRDIRARDAQLIRGGPQALNRHYHRYPVRGGYPSDSQGVSPVASPSSSSPVRVTGSSSPPGAADSRHFLDRR